MFYRWFWCKWFNSPAAASRCAWASAPASSSPWKKSWQEVGRDAARFFFLMRKSDSHLDFDLDLAKKQSSENPVFYVQYAHARVASIFEQAAKSGVQLGDRR